MRPHDILSLAVTAASCVVTANMRPGSPLSALGLCIAVGFAVRSYMGWAHESQPGSACAGRALSIDATCAPSYWSAAEWGDSHAAGASDPTVRVKRSEYVL